MVAVKGVQMTKMIWQRSPGDEHVLGEREFGAHARVPETLLGLLVLGGLGSSRGRRFARAHVLRHLETKTRQERGMDGTRRATLAGNAHQGDALTSRRQLTAITVRATAGHGRGMHLGRSPACVVVDAVFEDGQYGCRCLKKGIGFAPTRKDRSTVVGR